MSYGLQVAKEIEETEKRLKHYERFSTTMPALWMLLTAVSILLTRLTTDDY